ncbi:hypothetical protein ACFX13_019684 [Malus domestica]
MLINVLMISSLLTRDTHVEGRRSSVLGRTQIMVDVHKGNKLACLSTPSFMERLKELLILLLEDLTLHCYLVVLSF